MRLRFTEKVDGQILDCADALLSNCQGSYEAMSGASSALGAVKASTKVESQNEKQAAGATVAD